jgi:hypothetical protein
VSARSPLQVRDRLGHQQRDPLLEIAPGLPSLANVYERFVQTLQ